MGYGQGLSRSIALSTILLAATGAFAQSTHWVTNANDSGPGSLTQAIADAQAGDQIRFIPDLDGKPLAPGMIVDKDISILGRGTDRTIFRRASQERVLTILRSRLLLSGVSVSDSRFLCTGDARGVCEGGALWISRGSNVVLEDSVVRDNRLMWDGCGSEGTLPSRMTGGGIANFGSLTLRRSVVRGNQVRAACCSDPSGGSFCGGRASGGGIVSPEGWLMISASEVSLNSALSGPGENPGCGGIDARGSSLTIRESTISGNQALAGAGVCATHYLISGATIAENTPANIEGRGWIQGSILARAETSPANCLAGQRPQSLGHNLDSDGSCGLRHPSDLVRLDPMLGPLQDNFGPAWSHVPHADSPVIDRGACASVTDQRGAPRPIDGNGDNVWMCDLGAVEFLPPCDDPEGSHDCSLAMGAPEAEMEPVSG
jgi:hypothetical protein